MSNLEYCVYVDEDGWAVLVIRYKDTKEEIYSSLTRNNKNNAEWDILPSFIRGTTK